MTNEYNAESIKVLNQEEIEDNFIWVKANQLATSYPTICIESILIGLEACTLVNEPIENYEIKYLQQNRKHPISEAFQMAYKELVKRKRAKLQNK